MVNRIPKSNFRFDQGVPLFIGRVEHQGSCDSPHGHDFLELVLVTRGNAIHYTDKEQYPIETGDVFFVDTSEVHGYADAHNLSIVNILFEDRLIAPSKRELRKLPGYHALFHLEPRYRARHHFESRLRLSGDRFIEAQQLIDAMEKELDKKTDGYEFVATVRLLDLIGMLCRAYTEGSRPESRSLYRLAEVLGLIEHRFAEALSIEVLAEVAHMSPSHFRRAFQEAVGVSPIEYLIERRINRACELLRQSDEPVTAIAMETGFSDGNYFARQFRKRMGQSPRAYRKRELARRSR